MHDEQSIYENSQRRLSRIEILRDNLIDLSVALDDVDAELAASTRGTRAAGRPTPISTTRAGDLTAAGRMTMPLATATLATNINTEHTLACRAAASAIDHARRAGAFLIEAKQTVPHGSWLPWLIDNCPDVSPRVAQGYMRISREWSRLEGAANANRVSHLPIRQALALLGESDEHEDVDASALYVDLTALRRMLKDEERLAAESNAELQMLARALADPTLTIADAEAIRKRSNAIWEQSTERNLRGLMEMGRLLNKCDLVGWGDAMRELLAHPEAIPGFVLLCRERIAELEAAGA